ncbi:rhodanese-like domain-containing protein [Myxococcota bacterium]|nr:rhodanese-like domain-containing protein [Myxococcota bacterium]
MIRDRLKSAARKAAVKIFHMEFDVEERDPAGQTQGRVGEVDLSVIPKVVDGAGDTPGPKHPEDIGRTWVAAQVLSGEAPFFLDLRPPAEVVAGMLPGAVLAPGRSIRHHLDLLPAPDRRVTVYDQTGELGSTEVAAWLRENGWPLARRLRGGFAEWIEHGEPTEVPPLQPGAALRVGDPARLPDGRAGHVLRVLDGPRYLLWLGEDQAEPEVGPLAPEALGG